MRAPRPLDIALAAAAVAILGVALAPIPQLANGPGPLLTLLPTTGDLLRNLVLFAPLGAALALRGESRARVLLFAAGFSTCIELAQLMIPGRYTAPWDVVANAAGALLGAQLVRSIPGWLAAANAAAPRSSLAAAAICVAAFTATGILFAPSLPAIDYYAHWTPRLAHLRPSDGRVIDATLADQKLAHGRLEEPAVVRAALLGDFELTVRAMPGATTDGLAAVFLITDAEKREILMVGRNRDDLVVRLRSRATVAGFTLAILRIPEAFRGMPAATEIAIRVQRAGPHFCIDLDAASHCGLGFSIGDGWTLLDPGLPLGARFRSAMDFAFLVVLLLPCGYWFRRSAWASRFAIALVVGGVVFLPRALVLLPTPPAQLLACVVGFASGAALGARASRDRRRRAVPARAGDSRSGTG